MASEIKVDTISEKTSANGVTIDGVSLKDSKIATANSVDSDAYVDGSIDTAHIDALQVTGAKLNTDVISAQTALAAEPADTDEFMVSDAGVLKRIDYSLIKADGIDCDADSWYYTMSAQDISSAAIIDWDGEIKLGSNCTESGGVITVGTAGWYFITMKFSNNADSTDITDVHIRKNGTEIFGRLYFYGSEAMKYTGEMFTYLIEASASDTFECYGEGNFYGEANTTDKAMCFWSGVRLGA